MARLVSWNTVTSLWIVFCVYWAVSAVSVKPTGHMEAARFRTAAGLGVAAIVLVAAGIVIAIWARRHIGEFWSADHTEGRSPVCAVGTLLTRAPSHLLGDFVGHDGHELICREWGAVVGLVLVCLTHGVKAGRGRGAAGKPVRSAVRGVSEAHRLADSTPVLAQQKTAGSISCRSARDP